MRGLGADDPYWQELELGRLVLQQCSECDKWNWPPVFRCGECGSWEHKWMPRQMLGKVFSWTRTWHDFGAPVEIQPPFVSVLVELDGPGGQRLLGLLDAEDDAIVEIGQRVQGEVTQVTFQDQKIPVIKWRACGEHKRGDV